MPKPLRVRYARIAREVDRLLDKYRVRSHPIDIMAIAKGEGLKLNYATLDGDLSGFLLKTPRGFVIGVNQAHVETRQRFTIAHECGHALLHEFEDLRVDYAFKLRSPLSSQAVDVEEIEANNFAASLLMPEKMLLPELERLSTFDVEDERQVASLAAAYNVSPLSMSLRIQNLLTRVSRAQSRTYNPSYRLFDDVRQ